MGNWQQKWRPALPAFVAVATFLLHGLIALRYPLPGTFRKYALAAEQYLSGELPAERLMDFSPLYFHLSVLVERLFPGGEVVLVWLQLAMAAASVGLLFRLLERRFATGLALLAVATMALDRHLLVYERILEPEVCLLFLLLALLVALDYPGRYGALCAGLCAALCLATRPTFLPAFLLVPLYYRLRGRPRWRLRSLTFAAPVLAMVLLLALRAAVVTGDPRTPAMNPGTVFFEGNNPLSLGTSAIYPPVVLGLVRHTGEVPDSAHVHYRTVARAAAGRELTIAEVNAFWAARAFAFIRAEPGRFAELLLGKLLHAFHGFRWHDVPTAWTFDRSLFFVPGVPFALLSALALLGSLFEIRRFREGILFYVLATLQLAVMLVFYVSARQRLVLFPAVVYFAAAALERLHRDGRRSLPWLLLVLLLSVSLAIFTDPMRDEIYRRQGYVETEQRLHEIREKTHDEPLARHADLVVQAIASAPWWLDWLRPAYFPRSDGSLEERVAQALIERGRHDTSADFDLAAVHLEAGQPAAAERLLEPLADAGRVVYRGARQPSDPLFLWARAIARRGDKERAVEMLKRALERSPGDPFVLAELVVLTDDPAYLKPLSSYWSELDAQVLLGQALLFHARPDDAARALATVVDRLPEHRDARVLLAAALGAGGRLEESVRHYMEAVQYRPEPILESRRIVVLFRRWAAAHPDRADVRLTTAQVLHQHGYFDEALALLEGLEPSPEELRAAVARERERIRRSLGPAVAD